jgi:hypothetical protein
MSLTYSATAASASGCLVSICQRAASPAFRRFIAASASALARSPDRVLGFDGRGAKSWFMFSLLDLGSSARALRFPRGLLRGGDECAEFSFLFIASGSSLAVFRSGS